MMNTQAIHKTEVAQFLTLCSVLTLCSASNLAEARRLPSPWPGASPAKTRASSRSSRTHGDRLRLSTTCYKLSVPGSRRRPADRGRWGHPGRTRAAGSLPATLCSRLPWSVAFGPCISAPQAVIVVRMAVTLLGNADAGPPWCMCRANAHPAWGPPALVGALPPLRHPVMGAAGGGCTDHTDRP